jgi:GT2 family glycosyltransferase
VPVSASPVWIVILAWNHVDYTLECLTSILALDPPADRVLLVDNGSTDGTVERVRAQFPSVTVLALERNLYFAGGVNEGLRRAIEGGAGSALILNNDLVLERGALGALREALDADPSRAAVSPKLYFYDPPDRIWFAGGLITRGLGLVRHRGAHRKDGMLRDGPRTVDYVSGAAALLSRRALDQVGLLDLDYVMYVEDVDWSARAREAGFTLWYEPRARGWHHVSVASGGGLTPLKAYFRLRSGALFLTRHAAWWERPAAWAAYALWTGGLFLSSLLRGDGASARALALGFGDFTRILLGASPPARTPEAFARRTRRG